MKGEPTPPNGCPWEQGSGAPRDDRRQLTFSEAIGRALMWMIATLVSWLCYSQMTLQKQMAVFIERSDNMRMEITSIRGEQQHLAAVDELNAQRIRAMELKQAEHSWK
jgi:hypothetical protein